MPLLSNAQLPIMRLLRRFHQGFVATGIGKLASGRETRRRYPLCPMKAVPDVFIAAELGGEFDDWEIHLLGLCDELGLVEPKRAAQRLLPKPRGQRFIPLEYLTGDGARVRINDPPFCRDIEVFRPGKSEPDLPYSIKNRRYALTKPGWDRLREEDERDRQQGADDQPEKPPRTPNVSELDVINYLAREGLVGLGSVRRLPPDQRPTAERIAHPSVGRDSCGTFKAMLKHMIDLGWLDNGRNHGIGSGYFLTPTGLGLASEEARKLGPSPD